MDHEVTFVSLTITKETKIELPLDMCLPSALQPLRIEEKTKQIFLHDFLHAINALFASGC